MTTNKLWDPKKPVGAIRLLDVEPTFDIRPIAPPIPRACPMCVIDEELKLRALEVSRWADDGGAT